MFKWVGKHRFLCAMAAIFVALLSVLIYSNTNAGKSSPVGLKVQAVVSAVQKPFSGLGQSFEKGTRSLFAYRSVVEENEALKDKIAELEAELTAQMLSEAELKELRELSIALNYVGVRENYNRLTASVVSSDGTNWFHIFTIDKGTESGVREDDTVINGSGLIGRVFETGQGFSKVVSLTDTNANVSFKIYRDDGKGYLGIVYGDGTGALSGYLLDTNAPVLEGDSVVTSGLGLFPAGLVIGSVSKIEANSDSLLKYINVQPAVDFANIGKVLVLTEIE